MKIKKKIIVPLVLVTGMTTLSGCALIKPYDKPEYIEIKPNQTAFVIPLEGKTSNQGKFESEEFLKKAQVAAKRIQIPHKWVKTGRLPGSGKYVDTVRVIVVDRYPETREWKVENKQGFVGESKDSIKFEVGISATAQILEEDTARFLYQYSGKELSQVMDSEIRNRIGTVLLEKYSTMTIDQIRQSKKEVIEYVRSQVEPYFKERGITLSNIGYIGDLKYLQADIQEAINKKFKAEQEYAAQQILNKNEIEKAKAEKQANAIRKEAMKEILEMKQLEIQEKAIEAWKNGADMPDTLIINGDSKGNLLFNIPIGGSKESKENNKK